MLKISNIRLGIDDDTPLEKAAARILKIPEQAIEKVNILRKAVDARRKNNISFVYTVQVKTKLPEGQVLSRLNGNKDIAGESESQPEEITPGALPLKYQPVIIGAGPAGMLTALTLAKYGYKPILLERGKSVEERTKDIETFWKTGLFDENSNIQYGEGGAGTFSDGKLTTRITDIRMTQVLDVFIEAGAPPEIRYKHKPHIGTDILRAVVKNMRKRILELGGQVEFQAQVTDIDIQDGCLKGLTVNNNRHIPCTHAFFAIGHSARDTYHMLHGHGIDMQAKAFAIGVRIEHPQEFIDKAQYGFKAGHTKLGAADYALVYHDKPSARTAYSFCMCPGGQVVAAASEAGGVVTNGMSLYRRDSGVANSALVVNVNPSDFGDNVLDGIEFQRHYEGLAYKIGGENYCAPVQTVGDFLSGKSSKGDFLIEPTYKPGVKGADLHHCLPDFVTATLAKAIPEFGRKIRGFDNPSAVLTGIETRTSAPVRIIRNHDFTSTSISGIYPIGEGAGYAGGIMSAAIDGMNAALSFITTYKSM